MSDAANGQEARDKLKQLLEEKLDKGTLSLPVLPDVAVRVREALEDRNVNAARLARILEASPGLAARVLKMANSAMFAGRMEITDLAQAISRLGMAMVLAVVVGAVGKESFRSAEPSWSTMLENAWMASVFASVAARSLARELDEVPDVCFLAGLLHACGEPVLVQGAEQLVRASAIPRPSAEMLQEVMAPLIPRAGAQLLRKWGLSAAVVEAVAHQTDPSLAPPEAQRLAALTGLAAGFGIEQASGQDPVSSARGASEGPAAEMLGMDFERLERTFLEASQDGMATALAF